MTKVANTLEDPEVQELFDIIKAQEELIERLMREVALLKESNLRRGQAISRMLEPPSQEPIGHIDDRGWLIPVRPIAAFKGHPKIPVYLHPPQAHSYGQAVQA